MFLPPYGQPLWLPYLSFEGPWRLPRAGNFQHHILSSVGDNSQV